MKNKVVNYLLFSSLSTKALATTVRSSKNHEIRWGYENTNFPLNLTSEIFYDDEITMLCPSGPFRLGLKSFSLYLTPTPTCLYNAKSWRFLYNCDLTASKSNPDRYSFQVREPYLPGQSLNFEKSKAYYFTAVENNSPPEDPFNEPKRTDSYESKLCKEYEFKLSFKVNDNQIEETFIPPRIILPEPEIEYVDDLETESFSDEEERLMDATLLPIVLGSIVVSLCLISIITYCLKTNQKKSYSKCSVQSTEHIRDKTSQASLWQTRQYSQVKSWDHNTLPNSSSFLDIQKRVGTMSIHPSTFRQSVGNKNSEISDTWKYFKNSDGKKMDQLKPELSGVPIVVYTSGSNIDTGCETASEMEKTQSLEAAYV